MRYVIGFSVSLLAFHVITLLIFTSDGCGPTPHCGFSWRVPKVHDVACLSVRLSATCMFSWVIHPSLECAHFLIGLFFFSFIVDSGEFFMYLDTSPVPTMRFAKIYNLVNLWFVFLSSHLTLQSKGFPF